MLWLGDNVYADRMAVQGDLAGMRGLYQRLGENERFQRLAADTTFMATWDDHDYGRNDAGVEWVFKDGAQREFLRFWGEGEDDPRADQAGVYSARTFGSGDQSLQVILLDNRYHRDAYSDDPEATILGDDQWAWLRERLLEPATIRIIGSGLQVVNDYDLPSGEQVESWGDMPAERERLYALVRELGVTGVVIASGDMHHAELSRLADDAAGFGYPTYDLTGSGLDQLEPEELANPARIGRSSTPTASSGSSRSTGPPIRRSPSRSTTAPRAPSTSSRPSGGRNSPHRSDGYDGGVHRRGLGWEQDCPALLGRLRPDVLRLKERFEQLPCATVPRDRGIEVGLPDGHDLHPGVVVVEHVRDDLVFARDQHGGLMAIGLLQAHRFGSFGDADAGSTGQLRAILLGPRLDEAPRHVFPGWHRRWIDGTDQVLTATSPVGATNRSVAGVEITSAEAPSAS